MRSAQTLQVINFYLLSVAVLTAGYVSALGSKMNHVAGFVGVVGVVVTAAAFFAGRRYDQIGELADEPLAEMQGRLAQALDIESLRMVVRQEAARSPWLRLRRISRVVFVLAVGTCFVAAAYGFLS